MKVYGKLRKKILNSFAFATVTLTILLSISFISPVIFTYADEISNIGVTTNIDSIISISTNTAETVIDASVNSFSHNTINVNVSTNSQYGYTLTIEDNDTNTALVPTNPANTDTIASSFAGSKTRSTMNDNTWGFSIDNTNYFAVPPLDSPLAIKRTNTYMSAAQETTTVDFGTKVGMITSGSYQDVVRFSAYANGMDGYPEDGTDPTDPNPRTDCAGFFCISTMQEMTSSICHNTTRPLATATEITWEHTTDKTKIPRTVLTDTRDNTDYLVTRLADGRCWMTQNLELTPVPDNILTNSDTDLNSISQWNPPSTIVNSNRGWNGANPRLKDYINITYYHNGVTGSAEPTAPGNAYLWEKSRVYYNWYAATAGTASTTIDGEAPDSICPKGWKLPSTAEYNNMFFTVYDDSYRFIDPINFIANGNHSGIIGNFYEGGEKGYYWTSTPDSSSVNPYAYLLLINVQSRLSRIQSQSANQSGYSIRCVAR